MTGLLGLPPEKAAAMLEGEGYRVETVEARSRKGVNGDSLRVIRVLKLDEKTVQITYSEFLTNVNRA